HGQTFKTFNMNVSKDPVFPGLEADSDTDTQHVNNPVVGLEPIVKKYLGAVSGYTQSGSNFYFSDGSARVEIRIISKQIIRVRLAPQGVFLDEFSYAVESAEYGSCG